MTRTFRALLPKKRGSQAPHPIVIVAGLGLAIAPLVLGLALLCVSPTLVDSESAVPLDGAGVSDVDVPTASLDTDKPLSGESGYQDRDEGEPSFSISAVGIASLLGTLSVRSERQDGYNRDLFAHWVDADGDGCDTRKEVLIAESLDPVTLLGGCEIQGGRWVSLYDGVATSSPEGFDIDHFVPLKEAWESGADLWSDQQRSDFANDLDFAESLIAVSASSNRSKGAGDPTEWMPPQRGFHCTYIATWITVKATWGLSVDEVERETLNTEWAKCSS
jgi:hypothetical protein